MFQKKFHVGLHPAKILVLEVSPSPSVCFRHNPLPEIYLFSRRSASAEELHRQFVERDWDYGRTGLEELGQGKARHFRGGTPPR